MHDEKYDIKTEYSFSVIAVFHIIEVYWFHYAEYLAIFVYNIYNPQQSPFVCILYIKFGVCVSVFMFGPKELLVF